MAIVAYRPSDLVKIKIGEAVFHISPLKYGQKTEILALTQPNQGTLFTDVAQASYKLVKYCVKRVENIVYQDGSALQVQIIDGVLTDESAEELLNISIAGDLIVVCQSMLNGVPDKILNPQTGKPLSNVKVMREGKGQKK
jgi:hypothetical protein